MLNKKIKVKCSSCGENKHPCEFKGLFRRVYHPKDSDGRASWIEDRILVQELPAEAVCRVCLGLIPKTPESEMFDMYRRMSTRNKLNFGQPVRFGFKEFEAWIAGTKYREILAAYEAAGRKSKGLAPCVDRINSWAEYSLNNIQIITCAENSGKGAGPALGAKELTMKFFKKLREDRGLSKYEMARLLEMLPQTYYYYEDQAKGCSFEILSHIRKKLKLSWSQLGKLIDGESDEK